MCGIELQELNSLEAYTLQILDFRIFIDPELFVEYDQRISACYLEAEAKRSSELQQEVFIMEQNRSQGSGNNVSN